MSIGSAVLIQMKFRIHAVPTNKIDTTPLPNLDRKLITFLNNGILKGLMSS